MIKLVEEEGVKELTNKELSAPGETEGLPPVIGS